MLVAIEGFFIAIILAAALGIGLLLWSGRTMTMSGRVVSDKTHDPVPYALVAVESSLPYPWETQGLGQYVMTDGNGRFSAKVKGEVSVRVWKVGYAMASEDGSSSELASRDTLIEVRRLTSANMIEENISKDGINVGDGFLFERGRIVGGDDPVADIRLIKDPRDGSIQVEALRLGGLSYQEYKKGVDFYNTPEAPASAYSKKLRLIPDSTGVFYVVTRDGRHYCKLRLIPAA